MIQNGSRSFLVSHFLASWLLDSSNSSYMSTGAFWIFRMKILLITTISDRASSLNRAITVKIRLCSPDASSEELITLRNIVLVFYGLIIYFDYWSILVITCSKWFLFPYDWNMTTIFWSGWIYICGWRNVLFRFCISILWNFISVKYVYSTWCVIFKLTFKLTWSVRIGVMDVLGTGVGLKDGGFEYSAITEEL